MLPTSLATRVGAAVTLLPLSLAVCGCRTKIVTTHVTPPELTTTHDGNAAHLSEGIYYYLPKTIIRVTLPITAKTETPGVYSAYAPFFFPQVDGDKVITEEKTSYSIDKSAATIATRGVKDPTQMFVVKPKGGGFTDTNFHFVLNDQSVPSAISASVTNNSLDFALTTVESTASLFAKAATGGLAGMRLPTPDAEKFDCNANLPPTEQINLSVTEQGTYDSYSKPEKMLYCALRPDQRKVVFDPKPSYASVLQLSLVARGYDTFDKEHTYLIKKEGVAEVLKFKDARDAFNAYMKIMQAAPENIDSIANVSVDTYKAYKDAAASRLKTLTASFLGTTTTDTTSNTIILDVDQPTAHTHTYDLVKFQDTRGICSAPASPTPTAVKPISLASKATVTLISAKPKFIDAASCTTPTVIQLTVATDPETENTPAPSAIPDRESGLHYRMPGMANITLSQTTGDPTAPAPKPVSELIRQSFPFAQFGYVASLPMNTGGMKAQYDVKFDATTGALLEVTTANAAVFNADLMKRISGVAGTAITTQQAVDKQNTPAAEASPLAKAQAERKLLQEQLRQTLLKNCLNDPTIAGCADLAADE